MTAPHRRSGTPARGRSGTALAAAGDRIALMQTFVRIVEAGNLSAAAAQLGATQPTISRRLQALERALGTRLLQRSTHTMKPTEDGQRCYEAAKELLTDWAAFEADLRGAGHEPEGTLRVLAPHALGQQHLIGPLAEFLRRYPSVSVEWLLRDETQGLVAEGIDCAIQVGEVTDPAVVAIKLSEVQRIVVGAPSLLAGGPIPRDAAALARLPWLSLRTYYRSDVALTDPQSGEAHHFAIRPRMSTDSLYALRNAAVSGLGACIVSAWLVSEDLANGRLLQLAPRWRAAPLPVYLVYPHARFYPAKLRRFVEAMRSAMPAVVASA
jgi:DNA-binding transcriptional LysR family regulator